MEKIQKPSLLLILFVQGKQIGSGKHSDDLAMEIQRSLGGRVLRLVIKKMITTEKGLK